MVLQRNTPLPVWGWAPPGTPVSVTLGHQRARVSARPDGTWSVNLPAMQPGGPYEMAVEAAGARIDLRNILIGDVWVASGQSNMEFPVEVVRDARREIASAHDSSIRQFKVPDSWAETPATDLEGGSWAPADSQHVGAFTAVGYFFAREIRKSVRVPIGIINTSWGGSAIEAWLSKKAYGLTDSAWSDILRSEKARTEAARDSLRARIGTLPTVDGGLVNGNARWADPALDDSNWSTIPVPSLWERAGYDGLDGIAWYRTSFMLTDEEARRGVRLSLGVIDDDDVTWVNGIEVGRTDGYNKPRDYAVPPAALRVGGNVLVVRVADGGGGGGIYGDSASVYADVGGLRRPLSGTWKFKVGQVAMNPDGQHINKIPTVLYNRMVHPLLPFPIKGVLWYQGESNANSYEQARAYRPLFAQLIRSWRSDWSGNSAGRATFPFLWVQLPNFTPPDSEPVERSAWAAHRESMAAALALPNTGQAITIDVGEAADIHPRNKQDVGLRLALVARKTAYGQSVVASGPTYRRHTVRGGQIEIEFDNVGSGLAARGSTDGSLGGFAIAGADRRLVWAQARIAGNKVVVWNDRVPRPVSVRYAWANNPQGANLFNREGLPAAPFRTDTW